MVRNGLDFVHPKIYRIALSRNERTARVLIRGNDINYCCTPEPPRGYPVAPPAAFAIDTVCIWYFMHRSNGWPCAVMVVHVSRVSWENISARVLISEKQLCPFAWINGNRQRSRHGQISLVAVAAKSVEVTCGIALYDPFERCSDICLLFVSLSLLLSSHPLLTHSFIQSISLSLFLFDRIRANSLRLSSNWKLSYHLIAFDI